VIWLTGIFCGSRVLGTDMRFELLVALLLVVLLHFIERSTGDCSRRLEHPRAFGANPALKILSFDPYQFAAHRSHMTHLEILVRFILLKRWCSSGLRRDYDAKNRSFRCSERASAQVTAFGTRIRTELNTQGLNSSDRKRLLSVGYPTLARIAISIRGHPRTVE